jgi:hypothetical protein
MFYARLYDSTVSWYVRRKIAPSYVHLYAVTTLTSMAFVNIGSVVVLGAHWHYAWAQRLFVAGANWAASVVLAVALLAAHLLYSRWHHSASAFGDIAEARSHSPWPAGIYMLVSVVAFLYISTLAPPPPR